MKRARAGRPRQNTADERGSVVVQVYIRRAPGNIVRVFTVADARVSRVADAIEAALFAPEPKRRKDPKE